MSLAHLYTCTVYINVSQDEFVSVDWGQTDTERKKDEKSSCESNGLFKSTQITANTTGIEMNQECL